jgi:hypothetical protein
MKLVEESGMRYLVKGFKSITMILFAGLSAMVQVFHKLQKLGLT